MKAEISDSDDKEIEGNSFPSSEEMLTEIESLKFGLLIRDKGICDVDEEIEDNLFSSVIDHEKCMNIY